MALFEHAQAAARAVKAVHVKAKFTPSLPKTISYRNALYQEFRRSGLNNAMADNFLRRVAPIKGKVVPKARPSAPSFRKGVRITPAPKLRGKAR